MDFYCYVRFAGGAESTATSPPNEEPKAGARLSICEGFLRARFVLVNYHNIDKIWYDLEYIA